MSDEKELQEQEIGVGEGVSEERETAEPTAEQPEQRQPEQSNDDLDNDPRFRKWKSEMDRQLARERKEREEQDRRYQQMLAQQRKELRDKQLSEMDDYERVKFELEEERQEKAYAYQRLQQVEAEAAKRQALNEVSQTMGVPMDALMEAEDLNDAWRRAAYYRQHQEQQRAAEAAKEAQAKAQARAEKRERNTVDTGQGAPNTAANEWDKRFREARTAQDLAKLMFPTGD